MWQSPAQMHSGRATSRRPPRSACALAPPAHPVALRRIEKGLHAQRCLVDPAPKCTTATGFRVAADGVLRAVVSTAVRGPPVVFRRHTPRGRGNDHAPRAVCELCAVLWCGQHVSAAGWARGPRYGGVRTGGEREDRDHWASVSVWRTAGPERAGARRDALPGLKREPRLGLARSSLISRATHFFRTVSGRLPAQSRREERDRRLPP